MPTLSKIILEAIDFQVSLAQDRDPEKPDDIFEVSKAYLESIRSHFDDSFLKQARARLYKPNVSEQERLEIQKIITFFKFLDEEEAQIDGIYFFPAIRDINLIYEWLDLHINPFLEDVEQSEPNDLQSILDNPPPKIAYGDQIIALIQHYRDENTISPYLKMRMGEWLLPLIMNQALTKNYNATNVMAVIDATKKMVNVSEDRDDYYSDIEDHLHILNEYLSSTPIRAHMP